MEKHPRRLATWIAVAGSLAAGAAGLVWSRTRSAQHSVPTVATNADEPRTKTDTAPANPIGHLANTAPVAREEARVQLPEAHMAGKIVGESGEAIADAELSWTALTDELCSHDLTFYDVDYESVYAASPQVRSSADGSFAFFAEPADARRFGSVVWVTHPEYRAASVLLESGDASRAWPIDMRLQRAEGPLVTVLDADGAPVHGADVSQFVWHRFPHDGEIASELRVKRAFWRRFTTGADGTARARAVNEFASWRASRGNEHSMRVRTEGSKDVVLAIHPTFELRGRVVADLGGTSVGDASVSLGYFDEPGMAGFEWLHRLRIDRHGNFGQKDAPILRRQKLHLVLDGGPFLDARTTLPAPAPGTTVAVDLEARIGEALAVRVEDGERFALSAANVRANYQLASGQYEAGSEAVTDERGLASMRVPRDAPFWLLVAKEGYASVQEGPLLLPVEHEPVTIVAAKAGEVRGRVVHGDEPVTSFDVTSWSGDLRFPDVAHFEDADGEFTLTGVRPGTLSLFASSDLLPQSEPQHVQIVPGGSTEVVLELPDARHARGRVIDARTGEPIASARIALFTTVAAQLIGMRGDWQRVDSDGRFELAGFGWDWCALGVQAAGYAERWQTVEPSKDDVADLGDLPLQPLTSATIRIVGNRHPTFAGYAVHGGVGEAFAPLTFDESGVARLPGVKPSLYTLILKLPEGGTIEQVAVVPSGNSPEIVFDVAGDSSLTVELAPEELRERAVGGVLAVSAIGASGNAERWTRRLASVEPVRFARLPAGAVCVELTDRSDRVLATEIVELGSDPAQRLVLRLDGTPWRVRIVDEHGAPLPTTRVDASASGGKSGWRCRREADDQGLCTFGPLALDEIVLNMTYKVGRKFGMVVKRPKNPLDVTDVVFRTGAGARLVLRDGDEPRPAVAVLLTHPAISSVEWSNWHSKAGGVVELYDLAEDEYEVVINSAAYWPTRTRVRCNAAKERYDIALTPLGALECTVRDAYGVPAANAEVALRSQALDEDVARWIAGRMVPEPPNGLRTDANGKLRIEGLPRGDFTWRVRSPSGAERDGLVHVRGRVATALEVTLP